MGGIGLMVGSIFPWLKATWSQVSGSKRHEKKHLKDSLTHSHSYVQREERERERDRCLGKRILPSMALPAREGRKEKVWIHPAPPEGKGEKKWFSWGAKKTG